MTRLFVRCHRVANIVVLITALITVLTLTTNAAMAARLPGGFAHSGFSLNWLYWSIPVQQYSTAKRGH